MIFKIVGSIMIILSGSVTGIIFSKRCSERLEQLRALQMMLNILENQISYLSNLLEEAFNVICNSCNNEVTLFFKNTIAKLNSEQCITAEQAWNMSVEENFKNTSLILEDRQILISFGKMLGNSDVEGQIKNIGLTIKQLEVQEKKAEEYKKKNEVMYKRMGVLVSLAIIILLF